MTSNQMATKVLTLSIEIYDPWWFFDYLKLSFSVLKWAVCPSFADYLICIVERFFWLCFSLGPSPNAPLASLLHSAIPLIGLQRLWSRWYWHINEICAKPVYWEELLGGTYCCLLKEPEGQHFSCFIAHLYPAFMTYILYNSQWPSLFQPLLWL